MPQPRHPWRVVRRAAFVHWTNGRSSPPPLNDDRFYAVGIFKEKIFNGEIFKYDQEVRQKIQSFSHEIKKSFESNDIIEILYNNVRFIYFIGLMKQVMSILSVPIFILSIYTP